MKTYTLAELAVATGKVIQTVWRWRREGMPTIEGSKGQFIDGADFIKWVKQKRVARKRPCKVDQFFCFSSDCRIQRNPAVGSVYIRKSNQNLGSIEAKCSVCGSIIRKGFAMSELAEIESSLESYIGNIEDLALYRDHPV